MTMTIILGMALVTMLPRLIPAFLVEKLQFRGWVNRWLNAIPFAALGALIFPAVLSVKEGSPSVGVIGAIVAIVLSLLGMNVILVVVGAILAVFLLPV